MMPELEKWKQEQEGIGLYKAVEDGGGGSAPMLDVGRANRIVTVKQARLISLHRAVADFLGEDWKWVGELCDYVEDYQITVGNPVNSRSQYADIEKAIRAAQADKGGINFFGMGGSK